MIEQECLEKIALLKKEIDSLPSGYISKKQVGNNIYYYHQWTENGVKKSKYIKDEDLVAFNALIERKKSLRNELSLTKKLLSSARNSISTTSSSNLNFNYTLMHKNLAVLELDLDEINGSINKIGTIYNFDHLPLGTVSKNKTVDKIELNKWWTDRSIPASRLGIREALETMDLDSTKTLLARCYGLSLSDQYWICSKNTHLEWKDINFFNNDFSEDIGDILFGLHKKENAIKFASPDNTSDGNLKKRWKVINNNHCLIKGGSSPYRQQPLNEVIATKIMQLLNIPCVEYSLIWNNGAPYSVCADFVNENTELIPAWRIIKTQKRPNNISLYQHFVNCSNSLGIENVVQFLDRMIVVDYLILNEDRHLNNFGALRNAQTLQWLGMAPIYDSGSSLGYDKTAALMKDRNEIVCKPFKNDHYEQLHLVSSFDWIDFSVLTNIKTIAKEVLSDKNAIDYLDSKRIDTICSLLEQRVLNLMDFASKHKKSADDLKNEVKQNVAAIYLNE